MKITILPKTEGLKRIIKQHGADGWVVLTSRNHHGVLQTRVIKNNSVHWLVDGQFETS